jgi:predicted Zn-dependent protease
MSRGPAMILCVLLFVCPGFVRAAEPLIPDIGRAFDRLYNFDFAGSHAVLNAYAAAHPDEALPHAVRSAVYLFTELDRLGILESQFLTDDDRIVDKRKLMDPDPKIRVEFFQAVSAAESRAKRVLASKPDDPDSLLAMCIAYGELSDYTALVEKRQIGSMSPAKVGNSFAQRLLRLKPPRLDAYVSTGFSEYLIGSLPFFMRWFIHFDNIKGSKDEAVRNLELVRTQGQYLKPFAKVLLGIIYLREKQRDEAITVLAELARDYPANPLFRKELAELSAQPRR